MLLESIRQELGRHCAKASFSDVIRYENKYCLGLNRNTAPIYLSKKKSTITQQLLLLYCTIKISVSMINKQSLKDVQQNSF